LLAAIPSSDTLCVNDWLLLLVTSLNVMPKVIVPEAGCEFRLTVKVTVTVAEVEFAF